MDEGRSLREISDFVKSNNLVRLSIALVPYTSHVHHEYPTLVDEESDHGVGVYDSFCGGAFLWG